MGKVVINEHDATQTASKNSSSERLTGKNPDQQSQVKISRFHESAQNVGVKTNTKSKATVSLNDARMERQASDKATSAKAKPVARVNGKDIFGLPAGNGDASKSNQKIITQAKIVERTQVRASGAKMVDVTKPKKPNNRLDPELALLANRTSTAERNKADSSRPSKSMSGMIGGAARRPSSMTRANATRLNSANLRKDAGSTNSDSKNENPRFTKFKSALIGIGVAAVVAIVGFAAIGIFGNHKNMCTVLFESNGGSKVAGTEIVCGRTVSRPDDPTKEGFSFEGWTFEGGEFDFANTPLYKNTTLVARWQADENTEIIKVMLDANGGSISIPEIEVAKGKKLNPNSLSTPTRPGYVFEDWYLGDQPYDFDRAVEEDMTLRAEWSKQQSNTNNNSGGDTSTPAPAKVASIEAAGDLTIEIGKSTTINVNVLPSSANYSLAVSSSDDGVASCSLGGKTAVTCVAKATGTATIQIRDNNSGVSTRFKVTVPANDLPPISGGDDKPPVSGGDSGNTGGNIGDNSGGNNGDNSGNSGETGGDNTGGDGSGGDTGNEGDNSGDGSGSGSTETPVE